MTSVYYNVFKNRRKKKEESKKDELEPEDRLWIEIMKTLDKLEKGVEGDLSALGCATRNINRTTWCRILHTILPNNYKKEFQIYCNYLLMIYQKKK